MIDLQSFSLSDRGRRQNNEDFASSYEPTDPVEREQKGCLYIIADGVGGAAQGERASRFAAQKVLYEYFQHPAAPHPSDLLRRIMQKVNEEIHAYAENNNTRMATTMVAAVVRSDSLYLANVGDSRAYLIRGDQCRQLNRDHSIVGEMVFHGEITEAQAMVSPIKNRLTRSLGGEADVRVETYPPLPLQPSDKILLCTDGLTRYAAREDVSRLTADGTLSQIATRLVEFANGHGGADNTSVLLVAYQAAGAASPSVPMPQPSDTLLEMIETKPDFQPPAQQGWPVARLVAFSLLVLLIPLAGLGAIRNWAALSAYFGGASATATTAPTIAQPVSAVHPSLAPASTVPLPTNTSVPPTASSLPILTTTLAATGTAILDNGVCVQAVEQGARLSSLSGVVRSVGGTYQPGQSYYRCTGVGSDGPHCQQRQIIENPSVVLPGWWIIVPGIDKNTCSAKGGRWVDGSIDN